MPTKPATSRTNKRPKKDEILDTLHNEHRAMHRVLGAIQEQLEILESNGSPNYRLMQELIHYLSLFPRESHHPRETFLFVRLAECDNAIQPDVERLLIEHDSLHNKANILLRQLSELRKNETKLGRRNLLIRSRDYLTIFKRHMDFESGKIFPRASDVLTPRDWKVISEQVHHFHDPTRYQHFIEQYRELQDHFVHQIEDVAEEATLLEFFGLGAMVESVGILSNSAIELKSVVSDRVGKMVQRNLDGYKSLFSLNKNGSRDRLSIPFDCFVDTLDACSDLLTQVSHILRKTRTEINEPYSSRLELFHEIEEDKAQNPQHS